MAYAGINTKLRPIQETFGDNWAGGCLPTTVTALKRHWRHILHCRQCL